MRASALPAVVVCSMRTMETVMPRADETVQSTEETQVFISQVSASIASCTITSDKNNIHTTANGSSDITKVDGKMYLFELQPYKDGTGSRTGYATSTEVGTGAALTIPLNRNTASDRLYSEFVMVVYDAGDKTFMEVSSPRYVANPEMVAKNQAEFKTTLSRKGLNIELDVLADAFELGIKHASANIAFSQLMRTGIEYTRDKKIYRLSEAVVDDYDRTINAMSGKNMTVTAIILNDWNPVTPELVYPGTKKASSAFYYMFNAATQKGFEETRATAVFLVGHYNGSNPKAGKVSNWIIGSEINNQQWNYMGPMDLANYVEASQQTFRVLYAMIKSISASDRAHFSLDYYWNSAGDNSLRCTGREIIEPLNVMCIVQGQMEWELAYRPYLHPMTGSEFWDDTATGTIANDIESPIINSADINVLTDYISGDIYKTLSGGMWHVVLTEEGSTPRSATRGNVPGIQMTACVYSYYLIDSNPYIDAYILSCRVDAPKEGDLHFGLWGCDRTQATRYVATNHKKTWQVLKNIGKKEQTLSNAEFVKLIIGINKQSDVVPNFRWRSPEKQ